MSTLSPPPQIKDDSDSSLGGKAATVFGTSDQLVGAVEKTLSMLGFENTPAASQSQSAAQEKRKVRLSISEYRQRKKIHTDKEEAEDSLMDSCDQTDEINPEVRKGTPKFRERSISTSSTSSLTSDDDPLADLQIKAPVFNSEPTELERQREISNMRLKRAFGLTTDPPKVIDPSLKISPLLSSLSSSNYGDGSLRSGSAQPLLRSLIPEKNATLLPARVATPPAVSLLSPDVPEKPESITLQPENTEPGMLASKILPTSENALSVTDLKDTEPMNTSDSDKEAVTEEPVAPASEENEMISGADVAKSVDTSDKTNPVDPKLFYTPDDEDAESANPVVSNAESNVIYVPPFNNLVYPNNNSFSSSIDDDSRFQSRNPSPPPELDSSSPPLNLPC